MRLSIIIPVYKVEQTLERCVDSVLRQDVGDMEVILVDDGSPDGCPAICDRLAADSRISVIHQPNRGLSGARNSGLRQARGEYITFVDSDDEVEPGTYRALMDYLADNALTDLLEYPVRCFAGSAKEEMVTFPRRTFTDMESYWLDGYAYDHSYACNKIYRREVFRGVWFPEGKVFEDLWTLPSLLKNCRRVDTCPAGCYRYNLNGEGISCTATVVGMEELLKAHLDVLPRLRRYSARYMVRVVNRQIDVTMRGGSMLFPTKEIKIRWDKTASFPILLKLIVTKLIGYKNLCRILSTTNRS